MLRLLVNSTIDKGDGKMNSKNSLLKLGMASLAFCLLLAAFLTGCGGSNSSGSAAPAVNAAGITLPTTYTVQGKIVSEGSTQTPIGSLTVRLLLQDSATGVLNDTGKRYVTESSGEFSFVNLARGIYVVKVEGNASYFESSKLLVINELNTSSNVDFQSLAMTAKSQFVPGNYTLVGKVVEESATAAPIPNAKVNLFVQKNDSLEDTGKSAMSLISGEFIFTGLATGTYVLKVDANSAYLAGSRLALINATSDLATIDVGNLVLVKQPVTDPLIKTLDLRARLVETVSRTPLAIAIVSLDSGQSTVADGFGYFTLNGIASGTRRLSVYQPGSASFTVSIEVRASTNPNADSIVVNNTNYPINVGTRTVDLEKYGYDIPVTLDLHPSGVLEGTVKKFALDGYGLPTSLLEPYGGFEFDLWIVFPDKTSERFGSVVAKNDGSWRVDQLPPFEDNSALWYAVAANTAVEVKQADSGNVSVFSNQSSKWVGRNPVLASAYKVQSLQTTVMNFNIPSFEYSIYPPGTVKPVEVAELSTDSGASYIKDIPGCDIDSDLYLRWTGPGTTSVVIFSVEAAYSEKTPTAVTKTFTLKPDELSSTFVHLEKFKPINLPLSYGRYTWRMLVNDPLWGNIQIPSDSHLLTIRPSNRELSPPNDFVQEISPATYTVTFIAPTDPEASQAVLELYRNVAGTWVKQGTGETTSSSAPSAPSSKAVFSLTYPEGGNPNPGSYRWRVGYFYPGGPPMFSEYAYLTFQ